MREVGPPRVLLVEDDAVSLKLMRDVLQAHGYETGELGNGAEVVARAATLSADLVVMDIGLPGLDGVEATRQLKCTAGTLAHPRARRDRVRHAQRRGPHARRRLQRLSHQALTLRRLHRRGQGSLGRAARRPLSLTA